MTFGFDQGFQKFNQEAGHMRKILPRVQSWLKEDRERPFFLFVHTYDVHMYDPPRWTTRELVRPYSGSLNREDTLANGIQNWSDLEFLKRLDEEDLRYIVDLYDASILYVDDTIRRLVETLEQEGLWDNTILVITSDHGEQFLEHERMGHGNSNYEEEIRVPLILRLPGDLLSGRRIASPVRSIDIMPTLLDVLGTSTTPPEMRGTSLFSLLGGQPPAEALLAFTEKGHAPFQSLRGARYKAVHDPANGSYQLYDLVEDPSEKTDLGADAPPEALALKDALTQHLRRLREPAIEVSSPALTPEERRNLEALGYLGGPADGSR